MLVPGNSLASPTPTARTPGPTISPDVSIILRSKYCKNEHTQNDNVAPSMADFFANG